MDSGLRKGFAPERSPLRSLKDILSAIGVVKVDTLDGNPGTLFEKIVSEDIAISVVEGQMVLSHPVSAVGLSGEYSDLLNAPLLGTAAALNVGTSPNNILQLDGTGQFPLPMTLPVVYLTASTATATLNASHLLNGTTTLNLPAGANGAVIEIGDYASNFDASPVTIVPNGAETIAGLANLELASDNATVHLTFYSGRWVFTGAESFYDASFLEDGSADKHAIAEEGVILPERPILDFVGSAVTVTDDSGNGKTIVTITGGGGGLTVVAPVTDASFAGVAGNHYPCNGVTAFTLPAGVLGAQIGISDYNSTFTAAPLTITAVGSDKIYDTGNTTLVLDRDGQAVILGFSGTVWVILSAVT